MNEFVTELAKESHRRIEIRENDYKKDGLWYCGLCHTPKQYIKQVGEIWINAMCLCKCQKEAYDREEKAAEDRQFQKEIERRRTECFPTAEMKTWTFENDDHTRPGITKVCENYCEAFPEAMKDGAGLMFYGSVGTGKSFFSACIANRLLDMGYTVSYDNCRGYADLAFRDKEEFSEIMSGASLVVLDDMGMERDTDYMKETLFQILDKRCQSGKPLVVTTNLSGEQLKSPRNMDEERLFSRLLSKTVPILMKGDDRRRASGKETAIEWRDKLFG